MERRLATIQRCSGVRPIEGADRIEVAQVLGWECVVKKGEIKTGELGVYIEIDSIVPDIPVFEFMKERKFRVRTIRLKGQISQGLFLPLSYFPQIHYVKEDLDVTTLLGITKYEPEEVVPMMSTKKKPWWFYILVRIPFLRPLLVRKVGGGSAFPTHLVPKTDETRLQAFGADFLETYKDLPISITQKMDGSSVTMIWNKGKFSVASRNVWFPTKKNNAYWNIAELTNMEKLLKKVLPKSNLAVQGELCGPGVQGNKYKLLSPIFYLYGIYDIDKEEYVTPSELSFIFDSFKSIAKQKGIESGSLQMVPVITARTTIKDIGLTVDDWVKFATTKSDLNPDSYNEGIVVRSLDNQPYGVQGMNGRRFSWKLINPEFLLQYNL